MSLVLRETGTNISLVLRETGGALTLTLRNYLGGGVIQADELADFPAVGDVNILYLAKDTNKVYYWDSVLENYVETAGGGAAQVQSDWNQTTITEVDYIKNKPAIPNELSDLSDDSTHRTVTDTEKSTWNSKLNEVVIFNDQADDYALLATDKNKHIKMQKATATNLTINDVFASGESCTVEQNGAGQVTFVAGSGVTLRSAESYVKTRVQYSGVSIVRTSVAGEYEIFGDLTS